MYPKTYFKRNRFRQENGYCFVLIPFANEFRDVYNAIREALEQSEYHLKCQRADEIFGGGDVMGDILGGIGKAEIVIADVTSKNPNVFYELGIAHTVKDKEKVIIP